MRIVDFSFFECCECDRVFLFLIDEDDHFIFVGQVEKGYADQFYELLGQHFTFASDLKGGSNVS